MKSKDNSGLISSECLYTVDAVKTRLGLGRAAWSTGLKKGLPVKQLGKRRYVIGRQLIEWFETLEAPEDIMQTAV